MYDIVLFDWYNGKQNMNVNKKKYNNLYFYLFLGICVFNKTLKNRLPKINYDISLSKENKIVFLDLR